MDEQLITDSKTTLQELILRTQWADVQAKMLELYPDTKDLVEGYQSVFKKLRETKLSASADGMILCIEKEDELTDGEVDYDVFGFSPEDSTNYALDFSPWSEWLGYYCNAATLQSIGDPEFVAHCLRENTFYGFEDDEIQARKATLENPESDS
ncbi:DUF6557 family protein [Jonesiaceae bacterium BS-20]|uniref:DUF6557 family protein n=1 Tax=Jonesiaceae bacterium BS-20 TaxID=3120821 RepID=A0AAU7DRI2_9MICO